MKIDYFVQQSIFVIRFRFIKKGVSFIRKQWFLFNGMKIGKGTCIPEIYITWPHKVLIGNNCILEHGIYFKYDGIWSKGPSIIIGDATFIGAGCEFNISGRIQIGKRAMIASGCKFIDHDHGTSLKMPMNDQRPVIKQILIGEEVWLGAYVTVLKGVEIGKGAVIGAGSLILKNVGENEIWGGVPARLISKRVCD